MWSDERTTVAEMRMSVDAFVGERDWRRYHTPVNLASAMVVEAAELLELFQWRRDGDAVPEDVARAAAEELADVLHYALAFANATGAKLPIDSTTVRRASKSFVKASSVYYRAEDADLKDVAEDIVGRAVGTMSSVRLSQWRDQGGNEFTEDLPDEAFDTAQALMDVLESVLVAAAALGADLARELELKMEKNRKRFPVGSKPDVGY
jgi:NTP pyrophosphatase (non-canonical NTP hydrolase)